VNPNTIEVAFDHNHRLVAGGDGSVRFERVILMLDGDAAGRAGSRTISTKLHHKCEVTVIALSDGTQPDHLSTAEVGSMLLAANKERRDRHRTEQR